ncbi:hypothetical protein H0W26_02645 [Candidatus Dependentiae bacterium]|nr:hypothetical protein [Candidatus Dependentiae bacterium]
MKLVRYSFLAMLVSSSLCSAVSVSTLPHIVKNGSLAVGKALVGCMCVHIGLSAALHTIPVNPEVNRNELYFHVLNCFGNYNAGKGGIRGIVLDDELLVKNVPMVQYDLVHLLSQISLMGCSAYGAVKCWSSAYQSFKRACTVEEPISEPVSQDDQLKKSRTPDNSTVLPVSDDGKPVDQAITE